MGVVLVLGGTRAQRGGMRGLVGETLGCDAALLKIETVRVVAVGEGRVATSNMVGMYLCS